MTLIAREVIRTLQQNWLSMIEQMRKVYIKAGLYKQSMDGNSILKCLS